MAAGRKQQQQGLVVARRMWRVLRAVLYMLRRGLPSGRKLAMDLHLLLHRGKIAGKALGDLLTFQHHHQQNHHHHHRDGAASFSCRALDPGLAVHEPSRARCREVEFSCSNTPSFAAGLGKGGRRGRNRGDEGYLHYYNYDAADVARVFEMLNDEGLLFGDDVEPSYATPSPARLLWAFARSPAAVTSSRQLRIADSPSSGRDDADDGAQVDRKADEFIRRFYEQLRAQRSAASTPDYYGAASPYVSSRRTPRATALA